MKKHLRIALFILALLTNCEIEAQYSVTDSCNALIITNGSQRRVYPKTELTLSYALNSTLDIVRVTQSTVVASWTVADVPNIDSLYHRIAGYLSYGCLNIQCANATQGPTGPTGATGPQGIQGLTGPTGTCNCSPDTLYITSGEYMPALLNAQNVRHLTLSNAVWTQIDSIVSVDGEIDVTGNSVAPVIINIGLPTTETSYPYLPLHGEFNGVNREINGGIIEGFASTAQIMFSAPDTGNTIFKYHFAYKAANYVIGKIIACGGGSGANDTVFISGSNVITDTIHLTSDQIDSLYDTPITLVPSPGSGHFIQILQVALFYNFGTVAYSGGSLAVTEDSVFTGGGLFFDNNLLSSGFSKGMLMQASSFTPSLSKGVPVSVYSSGQFTGGDGSADIYISYIKR